MSLRSVPNDVLIDGAKIDNLPADTTTSLAGKQDTLVSGTNIKTINSTSLLGSGNIVLSGTGDMLKSENLSGLTNYTTARSNLGLGSAATSATTDFAPALGPDDNYVTDAEKLSIALVADAVDTAKVATGFPNRTDTTVSFNAGTRTFTITPVGATFDFYIHGQKFTKTGAQSIVIANTTGNHFLYFDRATGVFSETSSFTKELITDHAYCAFVYWDAVAGKGILVGDERHGLVMSGETHYHLHNSIGAQYYSGFSPGNIVADGTGTLDSETQLSLTDGVFADEDIVHTVTDGSPQELSLILNAPILYRTGADSWKRDTATAFPVKSFSGGSGRLAYNQFTGGAWQQTEVTSTSFVLCHIVATNDITEPIMALQGIAEYSTLLAARNGANTELSSMSGLPFQEVVPLCTLIYQTATGYSNTVKARIRTTDTGGDYIDFRTSTLAGNAGFEFTPTSVILNGTGVYSMPSVTDNGNGTITLGSGEYVFASDASGTAPFTKFTIGGATYSFTDGVTNYVIANYNSATPTITVVTSTTTINNTTVLPILTVFRSGTHLDVIDWDEAAKSPTGKLQRRLARTRRLEAEPNGLALGEATGRKVTVSSGVVWNGLNDSTIPAFDSTNSGTDFLRLYSHVAGVWTKSTITEYDNTQYDNGTALATLTANRYAVNWVFRSVNTNQKEVYIVLGTGDYTLSQAQSSTVPSSLPPEIASMGILLGRIIVQKSASTSTEIDSAFTQNFNLSPVSNISDTAYGVDWNGDTTNAPSKNAVYDKIESLGTGGFGEVSIRDYTGPAIIGILGAYEASRTGTLVEATLICDSLPVGSNLIAELRKNSTTSGNVLSATLQVTTTESATNGRYIGTTVTSFSSTAIADGDVFYVYLTGIGSTTPALNPRLILRYT